LDNKVHALIMLAYAQSSLKRAESAMENAARAVSLAEHGKNFEIGPERAYICLYEVMAGAGQEDRGLTFREKAVSLLMKKADMIAEPEKRKLFLESNAVYRKLKQMGAVA
jgi:hypothetical protein